MTSIVALLHRSVTFNG